MAKIGRPIKFVIRLTPEERTRLDGMIHCGKGSVNSALKARILLKPKFSSWGKTELWQVVDVEAIAVFGKFNNG